MLHVVANVVNFALIKRQLEEDGIVVNIVDLRLMLYEDLLESIGLALLLIRVLLLVHGFNQDALLLLGCLALCRK